MILLTSLLFLSGVSSQVRFRISIGGGSTSRPPVGPTFPANQTCPFPSFNPCIANERCVIQSGFICRIDRNGLCCTSNATSTSAALPTTTTASLTTRNLRPCPLPGFHPCHPAIPICPPSTLKGSCVNTNGFTCCTLEGTTRSTTATQLTTTRARTCPPASFHPCHPARFICVPANRIGFCDHTTGFTCCTLTTTSRPTTTFLTTTAPRTCQPPSFHPCNPAILTCPHNTLIGDCVNTSGFTCCTLPTKIQPTTTATPLTTVMPTTTAADGTTLKLATTKSTEISLETTTVRVNKATNKNIGKVTAAVRETSQNPTTIGTQPTEVTELLASTKEFELKTERTSTTDRLTSRVRERPTRRPRRVTRPEGLFDYDFEED